MHSAHADFPTREISSQGEDDMQRGYRYLSSSFCLTAALAVLTAMTAATGPQDNGRQEENHRDDKDHNRVYDRDHKDYHNWDEKEDRVYRRYITAKHKTYRDFAGLQEKEQRAYWNWRHNHPDHDHEHEGR